MKKTELQRLIGKSLEVVVGSEDFSVDNYTEATVESGDYKGYTFVSSEPVWGDPDQDCIDDYGEDIYGHIVAIRTPDGKVITAESSNEEDSVNVSSNNYKEEETMVKVRSTLHGSMNDYLRTIKNIRVQCYPETEVIEIDSNIKNVVVDTVSSTSSTTRSGLLQAERKFDVSANFDVRDTFTVGLPGRKNNTRLTLSSLIGVAKHIVANKLTEFDGYEGLCINHMDQTGNKRIHGFCNNRIYNLELCTLSQNSIHYSCMCELERLYPGHHFAISALDDELINTLRFGEDDEAKRKYMDSIAYTGCYDNHGTLYMGNAGLMLQQWKELWRKQLEFEAIEKVGEV